MTLPSLPPAFEWIGQPWGAGLRCAPLQAIAPHVFTTRQLELSQPAGLEQLADAVGARRVALLTQVHGNAVVVVRRAERGPRGSEEQDPVGGSKEQDPPYGRPEADALVSDDHHTAIAVRAADCVPLLMADRRRGVVAAVHAGWRGTAARAAPAAVQALTREFGTEPRDLVVAIGPSIGPCCYEVGSELVDAFAAAGHERHLIQRWFATPPPPRGSRFRPALRLDVAGANRDQLVIAGVDEHNIYMSGLCTAMHLDVLTSYRAEKESAGRIAAVIAASPRAQAASPAPASDSR
jgi:YfiH family protein